MFVLLQILTRLLGSCLIVFARLIYLSAMLTLTSLRCLSDSGYFCALAVDVIQRQILGRTSLPVLSFVFTHPAECSDRCSGISQLVDPGLTAGLHVHT